MNREQIIEALNKDLRAELSAVEMYGAHAGSIPEDAVAQGVRAIMAVEQRHARDLTARIKDLGGTPAEPGGVETIVGRAAGATSAQASTVEMLRLELAEEQQAIKDYAAQIAEIMDDEETMDLLEGHLTDEIQHARWMKTQIAALSR
ncbi:MAG: demethoxyubiquinone hydroxylase family protein [Chloroflexi bacterium]|jgi:bacterioferritin (cytochrome b1)|nr:demethoxyubiquinone hydroxylase family protein [Chloroflexota bacterium]